MARPILMPKPGQMTEECTLILWRKQVGDPVHKGDVLFEIETDKAAMEVETFEEGVLLAQVVAEGQTAPVNAVCGWIGLAGEAVPETPAAPSAPTPAPAAAPAPAAVSAVAPAPVVPTVAPVPVADAKVSPRARRLAEQSGINPTLLKGTGPDGRVVERDVQTAIANAASQPASLPTSGEGEPKRMSQMRRVIAKRLTESWTTTPHFTVTVAVDASRLLALRADLKAAGAA